MVEAKLRRFDERVWTNWHQSVTAPIRARFEIHNQETAASMAGMRSAARQIQALIGAAEDEGVTLRPTGSRWSFSEIAAATDGWALETAPLNWAFTVGESNISSDYRGEHASLTLVQAGLSIAELNKHLETSLGRSLRATGASNGQTFPGAMGTGTHGSSLDVGAVQSQVVGLQLIPGRDRNLWIERASYPVASPKLVERLGASLVQDDQLFEAALVSLGALGVIHAVMIETAPLFLLEASQFKRPFDDTLKRAIEAGDFAGLGLPDPGARPYFFQLVLNPYDQAEAYVKVMYQRSAPAGYQPDYRIKGAYGAGYDVPGLLGRLLDRADSLTPLLTGQLMAGQLRTFSRKRGTWGETFDYTTPRAETIGAGLAVPASDVVRALELVQAAFDDAGPAPLIYACRFVAASPGLLAFTRYDPTCVIDLDGLNSRKSLAVMEEVRTRFEDAAIPFSQHWGKLHGLTAARVRDSYGTAVDEWREARERLLPREEERRTFSSVFLDRLGLT